MSFRFNKIGIIGMHRNPLVAKTVLHTLELLTTWKLDVTLETHTAESAQHTGTPMLDLTDLGKACDVVIAVGGDGNLLNAGRTLSLTNTPVVGINRGELGFLTDIKPDDTENALHDLLSGQYTEETRFLVQGKVIRNKKTIFESNALNDVVLFPGKIANLIEFELHINQQFVYSQRSDGLIVATPTGSTAYSLSAGGPLLQPDLNVVVLTPMLPHTLTSRPIVVDADREIVIRIAEPYHARVSFDGQEHTNLDAGDEIHISKQTQPLRILHPTSHDYYQVLREKLHWGRQLVPLKKR